MCSRLLCRLGYSGTEEANVPNYQESEREKYCISPALRMSLTNCNKLEKPRSQEKQTWSRLKNWSTAKTKREEILLTRSISARISSSSLTSVKLNTNLFLSPLLPLLLPLLLPPFDDGLRHDGLDSLCEREVTTSRKLIALQLEEFPIGNKPRIPSTWLWSHTITKSPSLLPSTPYHYSAEQRPA